MELQLLLTDITIISSVMLNNFYRLSLLLPMLRLPCFYFHYHCELFQAFYSLIQLIAKSVAEAFRFLKSDNN